MWGLLSVPVSLCGSTAIQSCRTLCSLSWPHGREEPRSYQSRLRFPNNLCLLGKGALYQSDSFCWSPASSRNYTFRIMRKAGP